MDQLLRVLGRQGNPAIVSGIMPSETHPTAFNGTAGSRAVSLQKQYETALVMARQTPAEHGVSGSVEEGNLRTISVSGPFAAETWALEAPEDGLFVAMSLASLATYAIFIVESGPAAAALNELLDQVGLDRRLAAKM